MDQNILGLSQVFTKIKQTIREWNTTGAGNLSSIRRVDILPEVWVFEIPTKAWPLFPYLAIAQA